MMYGAGYEVDWAAITQRWAPRLLGTHVLGTTSCPLLSNPLPVTLTVTLVVQLLAKLIHFFPLSYLPFSSISFSLPFLLSLSLFFCCCCCLSFLSLFRINDTIANRSYLVKLRRDGSRKLFLRLDSIFRNFRKLVKFRWETLYEHEKRGDKSDTSSSFLEIIFSFLFNSA